MSGTPSTRWTAGFFVLALAVASVVSSRIFGGDLERQSWIAPARAARKANLIPASSGSIAAGRAVYADQCLCCHGSRGSGDGSSASDLNPRPGDLSNPRMWRQSDGALFWKINNGREPMPGFSSLLSEKDSWNVVNYLRTLSPAPSTQPATQTANGQ